MLDSWMLPIFINGMPRSTTQHSYVRAIMRTALDESYCGLRLRTSPYTKTTLYAMKKLYQQRKINGSYDTTKKQVVLWAACPW